MIPIETIKITVTPERNIEFPPEIKAKINPGEQYFVSTTEDTITLKKVPQFDWDDLRKKRAELGDDPNPLTTEEICEIVREVRREMKK